MAEVEWQDTHGAADAAGTDLNNYLVEDLATQINVAFVDLEHWYSGGAHTHEDVTQRDAKDEDVRLMQSCHRHEGQLICAAVAVVLRHVTRSGQQLPV